ncbi:MAG: hypothetical protein GY853_09600 [PVC group bacterium]|nr:hypothetical protein [PVC group bacterium]
MKVFILSLILISGVIFGQDSVTISDLPNTTSLNNDYLFETESPTTSYKVTWLNLRTQMGTDGIPALGINTVPSTYELNVAGDINFTGTLYDNGVATGLWNSSGSNVYYSTGNVGINDATPSYELDVNGTGRFVDSLLSNGVAKLGDIIIGSSAIVMPNNSAIGDVRMGGSYLDFYTTPKITMQVGDFGLGTTTPAYKLDVIGTGRFTSDLYISNEVGVGTTSPDEKLEIEWSANVDVEIGRGTTDTDVTFLTLRSPNGTKYYITVTDGGALSVSGSKP